MTRQTCPGEMDHWVGSRNGTPSRRTACSLRSVKFEQNLGGLGQVSPGAKRSHGGNDQIIGRQSTLYGPVSFPSSGATSVRTAATARTVCGASSEEVEHRTHCRSGGCGCNCDRICQPMGRGTLQPEQFSRGWRERVGTRQPFREYCQHAKPTIRSDLHKRGGIRIHRPFERLGGLG